MNQANIRQYDLRNVASFRITSEKWGELSNMCSGFPLVVNNTQIRSAEALYQACRFPSYPEIQKKIIEQSSPMIAKKVTKPYMGNTRDDWMNVRILIMKWVIRVKLAQNWDTFSKVLLSTNCIEIVEVSSKDDFWGAKPHDDNVYRGVNALGRLLMELRLQMQHNNREKFLHVKPLAIENFFLLGEKIELIRHTDANKYKSTQKNLFDT